MFADYFFLSLSPADKFSVAICWKVPFLYIFILFYHLLLYTAVPFAEISTYVNEIGVVELSPRRRREDTVGLPALGVAGGPLGAALPCCSGGGVGGDEMWVEVVVEGRRRGRERGGGFWASQAEGKGVRDSFLKFCWVCYGLWVLVLVVYGL